MTSTTAKDMDVFQDVSNPLDCVEEIFSAQNWSFNRASEDELTIQISGKMGEYVMHFVWQEDYSAMQFSCETDVTLSAAALLPAVQAMARINSDIWLGHFDIRPDTLTPRFRHTSLFRGMYEGTGAEHIEDLVDIALNECERYMPLFLILQKQADTANPDAIRLALMDNAGMA